MALTSIRIHTSNSSFEAIYLSTSFPFSNHTCEVSSLMLSQTNSFPFAISFENMSSSPAQSYKPPTELRLKIHRAVWDPRTVVLSYGKQTTPPITLSINYEARQETLKHYHRYT
ncbi:hypothetical protein QC761_0077240 [Podospora bellae-mahoneyi]|uniref:Uncharacterized protein n=1 Tax=Podospora bellae-mahoneyi TaxID=2093777 RepID=A0ABR0FF85_9PEZI|nr:hypothetical protein QC761_0077240 [Podospora bellae-mahoneyi]